MCCYWLDPTGDHGMLLPSTSCGCSKVILYNHNPWSQPDGSTAWREQSPSTCKALVNAGHTEHKNQMVLRWGSYLQTTKSDIRIRSCKFIPVNFACSETKEKQSPRGVPMKICNADLETSIETLTDCAFSCGPCHQRTCKLVGDRQMTHNTQDLKYQKWIGANL